MQGFIDGSYQNAFPQNGKISFPQSIDCSTPFRLRTVEEQLKENIEFTVASFINKITEQTQIIDENKEEICKLTDVNLHLESRVANWRKNFPYG
jgi:hypothetical protein